MPLSKFHWLTTVSPFSKGSNILIPPPFKNVLSIELISSSDCEKFQIYIPHSSLNHHHLHPKLEQEAGKQQPNIDSQQRGCYFRTDPPVFLNPHHTHSHPILNLTSNRGNLINRAKNDARSYDLHTSFLDRVLYSRWLSWKSRPSLCSKPENMLACLLASFLSELSFMCGMWNRLGRWIM